MVVLLDSTAVAAFLDRDDAFHAAADARVRELAGDARLMASVVSYAELLTGAGLGHHGPAAVRGFFTNLVDDLVAVDIPIAEGAASIRTARPSLRMPDALILATAEVRGAELAITADGHWPRRIGPVRIELLKPKG